MASSNTYSTGWQRVCLIISSDANIFKFFLPTDGRGNTLLDMLYSVTSCWKSNADWKSFTNPTLIQNIKHFQWLVSQIMKIMGFQTKLRNIRCLHCKWLKKMTEHSKYSSILLSTLFIYCYRQIQEQMR